MARRKTRRTEEQRRLPEPPPRRIPRRGVTLPVPDVAPPPVPSPALEGLVELGERSPAFAGLAAQPPAFPEPIRPLPGILRAGLEPFERRRFEREVLGVGAGAATTQADLPQAGLPPQVTTPHSPFALEAGLFHNAMMYTSGRILKAVDAQSRNFLPRQITDVIAALLPWRDWGFGSYQEALRALGYTEIPGAGTWMKDEEITSTTAAGGGGQTTTQYVTQRAGYGGGGGSLRSPNFSTLVNWRI